MSHAETRVGAGVVRRAGRVGWSAGRVLASVPGAERFRTGRRRRPAARPDWAGPERLLEDLSSARALLAGRIRGPAVSDRRPGGGAAHHRPRRPDGQGPVAEGGAAPGPGR